MQKSVSLWWPRYVGDYQRKTSHLTMIEHGAYTLLLDHYYSTNQPLAANASVLHRICRAFAPDEQAAVQSVLDQFFTLEKDGYHNSKADDELLKRSKISKVRKEAAKKMHKNRSANAGANAGANAHTTTTTIIDNNPSLSPLPNQKLSTTTKTEVKNHEPKLSPARAAARRGLEAVNRKFGFDAGE